MCHIDHIFQLSDLFLNLFQYLLITMNNYCNSGKSWIQCITSCKTVQVEASSAEHTGNTTGNTIVILHQHR